MYKGFLNLEIFAVNQEDDVAYDDLRDLFQMKKDVMSFFNLNGGLFKLIKSEIISDLNTASADKETEMFLRELFFIVFEVSVSFDDMYSYLEKVMKEECIVISERNTIELQYACFSCMLLSLRYTSYEDVCALFKDKLITKPQLIKATTVEYSDILNNSIDLMELRQRMLTFFTLSLKYFLIDELVKLAKSNREIFHILMNVDRVVEKRKNDAYLNYKG